MYVHCSTEPKRVWLEGLLSNQQLPRCSFMEAPTCKSCKYFCPSYRYKDLGVCSISLDYMEREFAIVERSSQTCEMYEYGHYYDISISDIFNNEHRL